MTERELDKMKRQELKRLLLKAEQENRRLTEEVERLRARLEEREIALEKAGSIAEASLLLSDVFAEAQRAADIYIENVRRVCSERDQSSRELAVTRIRRSQKLLEATKRHCEALEADAQQRARLLWDGGQPEEES